MYYCSLLLLLGIINASVSQECQRVVPQELNHCVTIEKRKQVRLSNGSQSTCRVDRSHPICRRNFTYAVISSHHYGEILTDGTIKSSNLVDPTVMGLAVLSAETFKFSKYSGADTELGYLPQLIDYCCHGCGNITNIANYSSQQEYVSAVYNKTMKADFLVPVLGKSDLERVAGSYFIPLLNIGEITVVVYRKTKGEILHDVIHSCLKIWPLLSVCLMMTYIAGFLVWITETWANSEEFPRSFMAGTFEGFWWAFISSTTVGYGDKAPRSLIARCVALVWILIGIVVFSIFTASLTTILASASGNEALDINGKEIAVLSNSLVDSTFVLKRGGIISDKGGQVSDKGHELKDLTEQVEKRIIDGFVVDRFILSKLLDKIPDVRKKFWVYDHDISEEKFSYGYVVKNQSLYKYFGAFAKDNLILFQLCVLHLSANITREKDKEDLALFQPDAGLFWPTFLSALATTLVIIIFGILYEYYRGRKRQAEDELKTYCKLKRRGRVLMLSSCKSSC